MAGEIVGFLGLTSCGGGNGSFWRERKQECDNDISPSTGTIDEKENVAMILWGIWFARNRKIWEGKIINPSTVVEISMKQKHDWQEAMKSKQLKTAALSMKPVEKDNNIKWKPPREGWHNLNVDASLFTGELSYSVGTVLRNECGQFVQGKNMRFQGQVTVLEAEARGVEEGIRWIKDLGVHNVEIESDLEATVKAMSKEM
ncbi:uncharacterized protein LOC141702214 [Apium graveolens]|uniref:uncharacterized protein LOC141702214 n=1 Tax=Apium graveolens TaxID=4045 RepID=UPI003D7BC41C